MNATQVRGATNGMGMMTNIHATSAAITLRKIKSRNRCATASPRMDCALFCPIDYAFVGKVVTNGDRVGNVF